MASHPLPDEATNIRVTPSAIIIFREYLDKHPLARTVESRCSKIPDIGLLPDRYFAVELQEPEHRLVLAMVARRKGKMGVAAMRLWCAQNWIEIYEDMKNCPGVPKRPRPSRRSLWTEQDYKDSEAARLRRTRKPGDH